MSRDLPQSTYYERSNKSTNKTSKLNLDPLNLSTQRTSPSVIHLVILNSAAPEHRKESGLISKTFVTKAYALSQEKSPSQRHIVFYINV